VSSPSRPDDAIVDDPERVVVRDKRRIDPASGELREPVAPAAEEATDAAAPEAAAAETPEAPDRVAELTADLQRLSAEYANYRKRVERDRLAVVEAASASLLAQLLPLLDDVDRARQHGDLTGGFKGVGEALEQLTERLGLERYGEPGEPFDPQVHEAVMAAEPDPASAVPVCAAVFAPGFRVHGRVLRAAKVSVAEAGAPAGEPAPAVGGQE
jgi:molecular chaperone GrpE